MQTVYLDCSGLPRTINVQSDFPGNIQIDGQDFINRFHEVIDRMSPSPETLRINIAKDFASAMISNSSMNYGDNIEQITKKAYMFADYFISKNT